MAVIFSQYSYANTPAPAYIEEQTEVTVSKTFSDGSVEEIETCYEDNVPLEVLANKDYKTNNHPITPDNNLRKIMTGIEVSTGLDLSCTDLSTFNIDFLLGYRAKLIQFLGVQFGAHKSLGTRDCFLPIQLVFRSSFTRKPAPVFMHIGAGYSFNTISHSKLFGDITATLGCGVNLVQRRKFQSNIVLAFGFRHFNHEHQALTGINKSNSGFAQISFGVSM